MKKGPTDRQEEPDFRSWVVLHPRVSLVDEVARRISGDGCDFSGNLVVFPGKRPAHFLRKAIAEKTGSSFIPPAIFSMEELVDHIYGRLDTAGTRKLDTIDAVAFLFDVHKGMERRLGDDQFLSLETFLPLGLRIWRDLEELVIEDVSPARVRGVDNLLEMPVPVRTGGSLQSLSFFFERLYPAIREAGLSSRSERYVRAASGVTREVLPYGRIVLAGFYAFTESERRLFTELLSWKNVCFLFHEGPGLATKLASLGIDYSPPERIPAEDYSGRIHFYKSPDSHGQVFALGNVLKERMEGRARDADVSTVVVLPTPESLFPVLYHALPALSGAYNISLGYPLERTPIWGFLGSLMQLASSADEERLYIPDYLAFVLHPYTKNIYFEGKTEVTRILFHTLEERLAADRTKSFISLDDIEGLQDLFSDVAARLSGAETPAEPAAIKQHLAAIHDELVRKALVFDDLTGFAEKMMAVLTFIYDKSSARLHPFFHPFAESFMKELDRLKGSRIGRLSFSERAGYFHFFRRYIAHCFSPFEGTPLRGVQVLGFLETRALRFERTYFIDANEDVIPDTRKEDSLIPLRVREMLRLPTYVDRDELSAYYFETLVKGSGETHLFFAENDRKEKSRFVERLLWERQKRDGSSEDRGYVRSCGYRLSLENKEPEPVPKSPAVAAYLAARTYDATSLDVYLRCGLRFYYRYVLGLARKEDASPSVERVDIGRLVHEVLLEYFEKKLRRKLSVEDIDVEEMRAVVARCLEKVYGSDPIGAAYLLRGQVSRRMEAFLIHYQGPVAMRAPVTIEALERRLEATVEGFRLTGVIDRIETRGEATCVIDYKTSNSPRRLAIDFDRLEPEDRASFSEAAGSLQLPFYLLLYGTAASVPIERMEALFLLLGRTRMDEGIEAPLFPKKERAAADYAKAREVVFRLMREIADPASPFSALYRARNACRLCDFRALCGMEWA